MSTPARRARLTSLALMTAVPLGLAGIAPVAHAEGPAYVYSTTHPSAPKPGFRVYPYLQKPAADQMSLNFFSELGSPATVTLSQNGAVIKQETVIGELQPHLGYTEAEANEEIKGLEKGSWLRSNNNFKYSVTFKDLKPGTTYTYSVVLDGIEAKNSFTTAPSRDNWDKIRVIAFSDTETEPAGRPKVSGAREWERTRTFAEGSLERPGEGSAWFEKFGSDKRNGILEPRYPLTQDEAMKYNMAEIEKQRPDLFMVTGDLAQGSGYQPGWDEYFSYVAGEHGTLAGSVPMLTAIGNWETFAPKNGGYKNDGVAWGAAKGRKAYQTYIDTFGSDTPEHQDSYYRVDHGPVTVITLDSTNGEPDENYDTEKAKAIPGNDKELIAAGGLGTDTNTQYTKEQIVAGGATDQPSFNPGSAQWIWAEKQLADAREKGQIIIVQFHHTPYSSGVHGTATASITPDDQPGTPLRVYTPMFEKYGVTAVISGHDEMFERSWVDENSDGTGFHNFDVGVAADGLRGDYMVKKGETYEPADFNTYREWMAQSDSPELWVDDANGVRQLKDGGKHYGHLQMDFEQVKCANPDVAAKLTTTPVYLFPVLDSNYELVRVERRVYNDVQEIYLDAKGKPLPRGKVTECTPSQTTTPSASTKPVEPSKPAEPTETAKPTESTKPEPKGTDRGSSVARATGIVFGVLAAAFTALLAALRVPHLPLAEALRQLKP